ncbi:MAG: polysaccharide biosynthesis tyrosine autokinase [Proteobacteria bacterium]|nr:polysaccharide biosynthesis tyrosine autokinase [Pseudomonadota bacterium]
MPQPPALPVQPYPIDDVVLRAPDRPKGLHDLWRIVRRRFWRCLTVFGVVCLIGVAIVSAMPRQYTAHTIMAVAPTQPDLAKTDQVAPPAPNEVVREPDIAGELQLMTAKAALLQIVRELHLDRDPAFRGIVHNWRTEVVAALRDRWNALIDGDWGALFSASTRPTDVSAGSSSKLDPEETVAEYIGKQLKVGAIGKSTTVDIVFTSTDPVMAAKITTAVAEKYIRSRQAARLDQAKQAINYLKARSEELLAEVTAAETAAENFRSTNVLRDGRDISQLKAEMDATNKQLAEARISEAIAQTKLEAVEARIKKFGIVGALESGTSRLDDDLRGLEARAHARLAANMADQGPAHPESRRAQKEYGAAQSEVNYEAQARLSRLRSDVTVAGQQVQLLEASLQTFRSDYDRLSAALVKLKDLDRRATVSRTVYEAYLERLKRTQQVGFNEAASWIISAATPPLHPSSPNTLLILGATVFLAAGAALSFALVAEHKDGRTILSSQHITDRGLKALGIVPDLRHPADALDKVLIAGAKHNNSAFSESIGSIFTSVMELARHEESSLVLLVTSSLPFEGKSTTITALAAKIASAGKRVLLVDADLRAPRLHHAFGITTERGLTECLDPARDPSESIHVDLKSGISVVTAGPRHPAPQNVLRSQRLAEVIETWRASYDFILVDSPPVLPISDARILVPLTDYCIFITRWRKTRWTAAFHALALLREAGARLAGIVVTKVDVKQLATYEFADSEAYGQTYGQYLSAR